METDGWEFEEILKKRTNLKLSIYLYLCVTFEGDGDQVAVISLLLPYKVNPEFKDNG